MERSPRYFTARRTVLLGWLPKRKLAIASLIFCAATACGQVTTPLLNNVYQVDGVTNTTPNSVLGNSAYGCGSQGCTINWTPAVPGNIVPVSTNPFGNTQPIPAPTVTPTSCGLRTSGLTNGDTLVVIELLEDKIGTISASATQNMSIGSAGLCFQVNSLVSPSIAGSFRWQVEACEYSLTVCTPTVLQSATNASTLFFLPGCLTATTCGTGPFTATSETFAFNSTGPTAPPVNTGGLIVSGVELKIGANNYQSSVQWILGDSDHITGPTRDSGIFQATNSLPDSIPSLMEPFGWLIANTGGISGHAQSADWVLYDDCTGTQSAASISPPHTFPPLTGSYLQINVQNPGMPYFPTPWTASTQYWGTNTAGSCEGSRAAINNGSGAIYKLVALVSGVSNSSGFSAFSCTGSTVGSTCTDGSVTWEIREVASQWVQHNMYLAYSEIYDATNKVIWEQINGGTSPTSCTSLNTMGSGPALDPGQGALGDIYPETGGANCKWMSEGTAYSGFIGPAFGLYSADGTLSFSTTWSQQVSGGGTVAFPYLTKLKLNGSGPSVAWNGCTSLVGPQGQTAKGCGPYNTTANVTALTGAGSGSLIITSGAPSAIVCPATMTCPSSNPNINGYINLNFANDFFVMVAPVTANGPGLPLPEQALAAPGIGDDGHALSGTFPTTVPPDTIGYVLYASNSGSDAASGNDLLQVADGTAMSCTAYIATLPYGIVCAPGSTWTLSILKTTGQRPAYYNQSQPGIIAGGSPLMPYWSGGCYGTQLSHFTINMSPSTQLGEGFAGGYLNIGCEESTEIADLQIQNAMAWGAYYFSPGAQNSNTRYVHTLGQNSDYGWGEIFEDVASFHGSSDSSYGASQGTQWLSRGDILVDHNLVSTLSAPQMGSIENFDAETVLENLYVVNTSVSVNNGTARCCETQDQRSSVNIVHLAQSVPSAIAMLVGGGGGSYSIWDDVINATAAQSTDNTATQGFYARGSVGGNPSSSGTVLCTDPGCINQFAGNVNAPLVPGWLSYFGDGSDGILSDTSNTNRSGIFFATTYSCSGTTTVTQNNPNAALIIIATTSITIGGSCTFSNTGLNTSIGDIGATGGGGGGGGTGDPGIAGKAADMFFNGNASTITSGGTAGAASGGTGGAGNSPSTGHIRSFTINPAVTPSVLVGGSPGGAGGNSGGAGGDAGGVIILIAPTITLLSGATFSVSGAAGTNSAANNTGSGGGGGGGVVIIRSPNLIDEGAVFSLTGGAGGTCGSFTGCGAGGVGGTGWRTEVTH